MATDFVMGASVTSVIVDVGLALAAFFVGACASTIYFRFVASKRSSQDSEKSASSGADALLHDAERSSMAAQQLRDLAQNVASDVGAHNNLLGSINTKLGSLLNISDQKSGVLVMESIGQLLSANGKLQARLEDAEHKIQVQAEEIRTQQSEARTDSLTKLANRRAFDSAMEDCLAKNRQFRRPFSVMLFDVDHFKQFNDAHGHQAGDEVLRSVGRTLTRSVKSGDLACRYGGEEFAVILANTKLAEAQIASERIRRAIAGMSVSFDRKTLHVTASIGVAELQAGEDACQLVRRADDAVYASKKAGRDCTHWHNGAECVPVTAPPKMAPTAKSESAPESKLFLTPAQSPEAARLPDRAAFADELKRRISESNRFGAPLSMLYFRIHEFEELENSYGKAVGELLIDSVAMFVRTTLRDMDLLAKLENGDLAIMLPGSTASAARIVGQRIKTSISHCPIPLGTQHIRLELDMGVAAAAADDDEATLMQSAVDSLEVQAAPQNGELVAAGRE